MNRNIGGAVDYRKLAELHKVRSPGTWVLASGIFADACCCYENRGADNSRLL